MVFVTGVYGLGENIVQGTVDPDEFYVHKPTFRAGYRAVLSRSLGGSSQAVNRRFCLSDAEVLELAADAIKIEDHYSNNAGHPMPRTSNGPRTAPTENSTSSRRGRRPWCRGVKRHGIRHGSTPGEVLAMGRAVGEKIASGPVRLIAGARELADFKPGEVLVAESTTPDWEPVMKIAAAIVTERGGRTCHAAIVGARARHSGGGRRRRREEGAEVWRRGDGLVRRGRGRAVRELRREDARPRLANCTRAEDGDHAQPRAIPVSLQNG